MMETAPIVLFTYNRLKHTQATINALLQNNLAAESSLFIFSDGPANEAMAATVQEVRDFLTTISGFKRVVVINRDYNLGLGNNIIDGVTTIINQYGKVIVLEDDLITSPFFLQYMNEALTLYEENEQVISIHGYVYPVSQKLPETFFLKGSDCLGWGTWKNAWKHFERDGQLLLNQLTASGQESVFDYNNAYPYTQMLSDQILGKNSSWAVRWYASAFLKNKYTLYPGRSLVFHNGGDGTGTNTGYDNLLSVELSDRPVLVQPISVEQNNVAYKAFEKFLRKLNAPSILYRIKRKWKKLRS